MTHYKGSKLGEPQSFSPFLSTVKNIEYDNITYRIIAVSVLQIAHYAYFFQVLRVNMIVC